MNRRSKGKLKRAVEDLRDADNDGDKEVKIRYDVVGSDGTVVETLEREFTVRR